MRHLLAKSRYLIVLAVAGSLLCATTLLGYSLLHSIGLAFSALSGEVGGKKLAIAAIELVDYFLLATVFYITALGLYELFIDDTLPVPAWLVIHDLDDLKSRLLGVVVTVLGVLFLGQAVAWDGVRDLQGFGFSIAAVIAAITFYSRKK